MDKSIAVEHLNENALDRALRDALGTAYFGFSTGAQPDPVFHFDDSVTDVQLAQAEAIVQAHDPVMIDVEPDTIVADGVATATITVTTFKANPAPVTLDVGGHQAPVTLDANGKGKITVKANAAGTISVALVNGANRCFDTLIITVDATPVTLNSIVVG